MKVLQIIDRLDIGGAERVFVDLTNLLDTSKNIDVSISHTRKHAISFAILNNDCPA